MGDALLTTRQAARLLQSRLISDQSRGMIIAIVQPGETSGYYTSQAVLVVDAAAVVEACALALCSHAVQN